MGRPTGYRPEYCEEIVRFCEAGGFVEGFACKIGVHLDTLKEWAKVHKEFSSAYKRAKQGNKNFLLRAMEGNAVGKLKGSAVAGIFLLKACHGMRDDAVTDDEDTDMEFDFEGES